MSSSHTLGEAEEEGLRRGKWRGRERFVNGIGECAVEMDTSHRGCIQGGGGKACLVFLHRATTSRDLNKGGLCLE